METFHLTRNEMANLLLSLRGWHTQKPLGILQEAWTKSHKKDIESGQSVTAFITTALSPIFEKLIKIEDKDVGFSVNEIVALGNQIENTSFSATAMHNWLKRDIKEMIGLPRKGKKYSIEQVALLFIVEDLKTVLDFESIRKLLRLVVKAPANRRKRKDLIKINPVQFYVAYSALFEELNQGDCLQLNATDTIHTIENTVKEKAEKIASRFEHIHHENPEAIRNTIIIATLAVHAEYVQMLTKRYVSATLFLQNLDVKP